jgi:hypothetical protein
MELRKRGKIIIMIIYLRVDALRAQPLIFIKGNVLLKNENNNENE